MKILIVANNNPGKISPFVMEQVQSLKKEGIEVEIFGVVGKGALGYLRNLSSLKKKIKEFHPDAVHAHYGLCGLLANLQRRVPVVTTYLGSDIHSRGWLLKVSKLAMKLSAFNIFVTKGLFDIAGYKKKNYAILFFGIDFEIFTPVERNAAREKAGMGKEEKVGFFSGSFSNAIKNYPLAKEGVERVPGVKLMEMKGYTREQMALLMNACNFLLVTSFRESGPTVVKEAMACGAPVVSVDVGDVKEVTAGVEGCYVAERSAEDIAAKIKEALAFEGKTKGRERIAELGFSIEKVASTLKEIYEKVIAGRCK